SGVSVAASAKFPTFEPSNLTATNAVNGVATLNWADNSSDETSFRIERASAPGYTWQQVAEVGVNTTSYVVSNTPCNTNSHYRVRAYRANDAFTSLPSNAALISVPCAPTSPSASASGATKIITYWSDSTVDEQGMILEYSTNQVNWTTVTLPANSSGYAH